MPTGSTPVQIFAAACDHARRGAMLATVDALVGWDERTMMPAAAGAWRADQAAELAAVVHRHRTDRAQGERLEALAARGASMEEVQRRYAQAAYDLTGSYAKAGERLGVDWRTIRSLLAN